MQPKTFLAEWQNKILNAGSNFTLTTNFLFASKVATKLVSNSSGNSSAGMFLGHIETKLEKVLGLEWSVPRRCFGFWVHLTMGGEHG